MRLPFLQVTMELIEQASLDVAVKLDLEHATALGGLILALKWGLGRCPEDAPPSANDVVYGPDAAKLIARAAGYRGNPEAFVAACEDARPSVLERLPDGAGIRFRGFDRYDETWAKARSRSEAARTAAEARWGKRSPDASEMRPACVGDASAMPRDAYTQTQTHTQIDTISPPPPAPRRSKRSALEPEQKQAAVAAVKEWSVHHQQAHPGAAALKYSDGFGAWYTSAAAEVGHRKLTAAFVAYLRDAFKRAEGHPLAVFQTEGVWRPRVPEDEPEALPTCEATGCTEPQGDRTGGIPACIEHFDAFLAWAHRELDEAEIFDLARGVEHFHAWAARDPPAPVAAPTPTRRAQEAAC